MRRRVAERIFGPRRVRRGLAQGARARRGEPHSYWVQGLPPAVVVVIDEWCGRSYLRPGLPAAVARDNTTRRERLSKGSVAEAHAFGKNYNSVAEALGLHLHRGPMSNSSIEWSTDTSA